MYRCYAWASKIKGLPEPGALSLLTIGLVGIAWVRRRKIAKLIYPALIEKPASRRF